MALAVAISVTVTDKDGKRATTKVRVPTGFSISQYSEFAVSFGTVISNLTEAQVTSLGAGIGLDLSSAVLRTVANLASDVLYKAQFIVNSAVAGFKKLLRIPSLDEQNVTVGSDNVNLSDPEVATLVSVFEDGVATAGGTIQPTDARGHDLTAVTQGREFFRRK